MHNDVKRWAPMIALGALALWLLTYPFNFAGEVITPWLGDHWIGKLNTISNVVMFMPFGITGGWAMFTSMRRRGMTIVVIAMIALTISLVGETAQVWLPDRHSSFVDLLANTLGATIGAVIGCRYADDITHRWHRIAVWLAPRPRWRTALKVVGVMLLARLAPFMFSIETYYLRTDLDRTIERLWPTSLVAVGNMALSFALLMLTALCVGRAMRESFERQGDRNNPAALVLLVGALCAIGTELLQWPIRGRVMDGPDAVAAMAGVLAGVALDTLLGPLSKTARS